VSIGRIALFASVVGFAAGVIFLVWPVELAALTDIGSRCKVRGKP